MPRWRSRYGVQEALIINSLSWRSEKNSGHYKPATTQPNDKPFPKQRATGVKHFIRFIFRKESCGGERYKKLCYIDCDALKFFGLSYIINEIANIDETEFEILLIYGEDFFRRREISHLLYRPDVNKAADAKVDPDNDMPYNQFIQGI